MSTRRGFLAGAAGGAVVARPGTGVAAESIQARREIVRRGRAIAVARKVIVAHHQRRTIAIGSTLVDVGGQPLAIAVSPDGRTAAVTTAFWDEPGLAIIDLRRRALRTRIAVGPAPLGVTFTSDGSRLVVAGGEQDGGVHVLDARSFEIIATAPIGRCPRGIVAAPGRDAVWVALNGRRVVARINTTTGKVERVLRVPQLPDELAMSPNGRRLLITHGGHDAAKVTEVEIASRELHRHDVGRLPSAVAYTRDGRRIVALGGTGEIVVGRRRHRVGGSPRGLAVAGRRVYTVDALTGAVHKVRI